MSEKLAEVEKRIAELEKAMAEPGAASRPSFGAMAREHGLLLKTAEKFRSIGKVQSEIAGLEKMLAEKDGDEELISLAAEEAAALKKKKEQLEDELLALMADRQAPPQEDAIVEIRAGTGGEEACLFARDLFSLYDRFAAARGWKVDVMHTHVTDLGGFREIIFGVEGKDAYRVLRFESGGHRVQRVPKTEASGRIHTSAVTVAVLPQVEEVDIEIDPNDLRIDTFRSSGPGGQSVNKTSSAVRITHVPSGMVVSCQDEKSQHKNRAKAMKILRSRLYSFYRDQQKSERDQTRRTLIGSGDRSDKIRTYNFPQNRVTDHRINLTIYTLDRAMMGEIDEIVDALQARNREEVLEAVR